MRLVLSRVLRLAQDRDQQARCRRAADDPGHVGPHGVHQQVVVRVLLLADVSSEILKLSIWDIRIAHIAV